MPQFFIHRPVFAWVIALFIVLLGVLAIPQLPISRYPTVAPPTRSEEHTSELQSQSNLVCRLLLEKKKKRYIATEVTGANATRIIRYLVDELEHYYEHTILEWPFVVKDAAMSRWDDNVE